MRVGKPNGLCYNFDLYYGSKRTGMTVVEGAYVSNDPCR